MSESRKKSDDSDDLDFGINLPLESKDTLKQMKTTFNKLNRILQSFISTQKSSAALHQFTREGVLAQKIAGQLQSASARFEHNEAPFSSDDTARTIKNILDKAFSALEKYPETVNKKSLIEMFKTCQHMAGLPVTKTISEEESPLLKALGPGKKSE